MSPRKGLCTISEKSTAHSKTHKIRNLVLLSVTLDSPSSVHSAVGGFNLDLEDFLSQGFSFVTPRKVGQTKWVKQTNKQTNSHIDTKILHETSLSISLSMLNLIDIGLGAPGNV